MRFTTIAEMVASLGIFQYLKNRYQAVSPIAKSFFKYGAMALAIFLGVFWLLWTLGECILELLSYLARNIFVVLFIILVVVLFAKNL